MMTLCFGCCFWLRLRLRRRRLEHFFLDFFPWHYCYYFSPLFLIAWVLSFSFFSGNIFFSVWSLSFRCIIFLAFFGNEFFVSFLSFSFFSVDPFFFFESLVSLSLFSFNYSSVYLAFFLSCVLVSRLWHLNTHLFNKCRSSYKNQNRDISFF